MPFSNSFIEQTIKIDSKTTLERKNINFVNNDYAFLSSFPRSGNGWVRLIFASLILEINGIDINTISILPKKTSTGVGYMCLKSGQKNFDLEDIFPNIYILDSQINQRLQFNDTKSLKFPVKIIKTHQIVLCNFNKALFLFREPLSCLTSAALLLNKEAIQNNPIEINQTIKYLSRFYSRIIRHYLNQKKQYPDSCFFLHHGYLSDQQAASYFVNSFKFLNPNIPVNEKIVHKALAKFPLKSGYDKTLAENVTKSTAVFVKDIIQDNYEKALNLCG